jgi:hypothetical protein
MGGREVEVEPLREVEERPPLAVRVRVWRQDAARESVCVALEPAGDVRIRMQEARELVEEEVGRAREEHDGAPGGAVRLELAQEPRAKSRHHVLVNAFHTQ